MDSYCVAHFYWSFEETLRWLSYAAHQSAVFSVCASKNHLFSFIISFHFIVFYLALSLLHMVLATKHQFFGSCSLQGYIKKGNLWNVSDLGSEWYVCFFHLLLIVFIKHLWLVSCEMISPIPNFTYNTDTNRERRHTHKWMHIVIYQSMILFIIFIKIDQI